MYLHTVCLQILIVLVNSSCCVVNNNNLKIFGVSEVCQDYAAYFGHFFQLFEILSYLSSWLKEFDVGGKKNLNRCFSR